MCTGATTFMTCGHQLIHYTTRCAASFPGCKEPCKNLTGPHKKLNDTCARCHPPMVIAEINRRHDALRENLTRQMRGAKIGKQALEIRRRIEEGSEERRKEIQEAGKLRWDGFVDWGVVGVAGEETTTNLA